MTDMINLVFNSLNNDELYDLFRRPPSETELSNHNSTSTTYEDNVAQHLNLSSEELNYETDSDQHLPPVPLSKYITESQLNDIMKKFSKDTFSTLHLNIRSISKHFDELQILLNNQNKHSFSVIGLSETWLSSNTNLPFAIHGYDFIVNNRVKKSGGGVALYLSHYFKYTVLDELNFMNDFIESLFVEITIPHCKNIIVGIIYRPPNSNSNDFLTCLTSLLSNALFVNKNAYVMGDFNFDLLKHASNHSSHEFLESFLSASFLPLISKPTRVSSHSATLLDNIFCNSLPLPESLIILSDITDHYPIMSHFNIQHSLNKSYPIPARRRATPENLASLGASLDRVDWSSVFNTEDVDLSLNNFMNIFNKHLDDHIPKKNDKKVNYKTSPRLPWISKSILRSINRKNRLYYKFKMKKSENSKIKYTSYKNTLTKLLRAEKRKYYTIQLEQYKHDMKNTWKVIKQAMNISKKKSNINKIRFNNQTIEDPKEIANVFNSYFSSIGENLANKIPSSNKHFSKFLGQPNANSIFFSPATKYEVTDIVTSLSNKQSAGHDDISNFILKNIVSSIAEPLTHIFNRSILSGIFPEEMKIAKVIPLFKKGDDLDTGNYRPISLLSSLSKILEKLIFTRTIKFLITHDIFTNSQFGFRQKHSTIHALLNFVDKTAHAIDNHSHLIGIFLDFSKAFDTINHEILLSKLTHYGIRGIALEWFRNYLQKRKQYVSLNGHCSVMKEITCGVPQGSILGPLLFIIYINDFHRSSDILSFILFADDSNVFLSNKNPHTLVQIINSELTKLTQWIRANKLSLNLQKTKYMLFSNTIESLPSDIIFDDTPLECVSEIKFLGVTVDNKLTWKPHILNICKTLSRNIGIINKLKHSFPLTPLLMLYSSLILPYINYGILVWGKTHNYLLDKLITLQKKSLRIICNTTARSHTEQLFFKHKILNVKDLYLFQLGQFMYKYNINALPNIFNSIFQKNQSFHNYPTRQSNEFHLPRLRTLLAQNTFLYTGPKYWNSLDNEIKNARSLSSFKHKLKISLLKPLNNCNTNCN